MICKEVGPTTGKMAAALPRKKKYWDSTASSPGQSARGSCRDFSAKGGGEGNDLQAAAAHTFGASGANGAGAPGMLAVLPSEPWPALQFVLQFSTRL